MPRDLLATAVPKDLLMSGVKPEASKGKPKDLLAGVQAPSFMESVGKFVKGGALSAVAQGEVMKPHVKRYVKDALSGYVSVPEGMARGVQAFLPNNFVGSKVSGWVADRAKVAREFYQPPDPNFSDAVASGFGSMAGFLIPGFAVSKSMTVANLAPTLAKWLGAATSGVLESMAEAGSVYSRAREKANMTEKDAVGAATKTFWLNLPTVVFTNRLGIFGDKGGAVLKALKSAPIEGFQEWTQQLIGNISVEDPTFEGALDAALVGAIVGGVTGGVVGGFQGKAEKVEPTGVPGTPTGLTIPPSRFKSTEEEASWKGIVIKDLKSIGLSDENIQLAITGKVEEAVDKQLGSYKEKKGDLKSLQIEELPDGTREAMLPVGPGKFTPRNIGQLAHREAIEMARVEAIGNVQDILSQPKPAAAPAVVEMEIVDKVVSKYPQHITGQTSLETVGNKIAQEMGVAGPIKWVYKKLGQKGLSGTHYKQNAYKPTAIIIRVGQAGAFKTSKGATFAASQGKIKSMIVHELVHALPQMKEKRVRGVMHPKGFYDVLAEERALRLFDVKQINRNVQTSPSTVSPKSPAASTITTVSPSQEVEKSIPLTGMSVKDFADGALINKGDRSTDRILDVFNEKIRKKMGKAIEDYRRGKNPYTLNPLVDTTIAFQGLEEKTGFPMYSKYYVEGIKARNTVAYEVSNIVNDFTEGLKKGYQTSASTERIITWIVKRKGSLRTEEQKIANKLIKVFADTKNTVSYLRMRRFIDGAEQVPKALEDIVMQGEKVFSEQGRDGLEQWVKGKDFGVVPDDRYFPAQLLYSFRTHISSDPFEVFSPYLHSRNSGAQSYDYSMSLTQKLHSYLTRIYSDYYMYDLLKDLKNDLSGTTIPFETLDGLKRWTTAIQGKGTKVGVYGQFMRKARGQFFKTVLADPRKFARNLLQPYYMIPQNYSALAHAKKLSSFKNFKTTPEEKKFFSRHVSQLRELRREQLYLYEKFFDKGWLGKVDNAAIKMAELYTKTDEVNRWTTFKYTLARIDKSIADYKSGRIPLHKFLSDNGMSSFYDLEVKHILSLPPELARLEVAKLMTEKTQIRYKKVERGIGALSELGEIATSLIQYPKGIITRYLDGADMVTRGATHQERWEGAQLLIGLALYASLANEVLKFMTGESAYYDIDLHKEVTNDPYALLNMISNFTLGGAQLSHTQTAFRANKILANLIVLEASGELTEKQRMTMIRNFLKQVDYMGQAYIPFLKKSLDIVESFEGTRSHKLLTHWFDTAMKRTTALRKNKIERDWVDRIRHALFGTEKPKEKK